MGWAVVGAAVVVGRGVLVLVVVVVARNIKRNCVGVNDRTFGVAIIKVQ